MSQKFSTSDINRSRDGRIIQSLWRR